MKKFLVLAILFALPIVAYLFFSSGVNNFAKLPVVTSNVKQLDAFHGFHSDSLIQLDDKITILSIYGSNITSMEGNAFNLNEKIYDKNYEFNDLQFVVLAEEGTQSQAKALLDELATTVDVKKWKFAFGSTQAIQAFFDSLHTDQRLNQQYATPYTFIIDKQRNLRGRPAESTTDSTTLYGYDTRSIAHLTNNMVDDVKVILAEYRLALKKYNRENSLVK